MISCCYLATAQISKHNYHHILPLKISKVKQSSLNVDIRLQDSNVDLALG